MPEITRKYQTSASDPSFVQGQCIACGSFVTVPPALFSDDTAYSCRFCGRETGRLDLVRESLARLERTNWHLFACDMYISDVFELKIGDNVIYDIETPVAKWLEYRAFPQYMANSRYYAALFFSEKNGNFTVYKQRPLEELAGLQGEPELETINCSWHRFGLSHLYAVPAWRQSLFGAAMLIPSNPSAAVVLIAAGFESFFMETMRIAWQQNGLEESAFKRLADGRSNITDLVRWLPSAVRNKSLIDAPDNLHSRWARDVNKRRNAVVHGANVNITAKQATSSLKIALEAITYIDKYAIARPHLYYTSVDSPTTEVDEAEVEIE